MLSTVDSEMGESSSKSLLGGAFEGRSCSARAVHYNSFLKASSVG
jgi:hypothetical protein